MELFTEPSKWDLTVKKLHNLQEYLCCVYDPSFSLPFTNNSDSFNREFHST